MSQYKVDYRDTVYDDVKSFDKNLRERIREKKNGLQSTATIFPAKHFVER